MAAQSRKSEALARVVQVAADLFATRAYDKVSIVDIAAAARCSTATIYEVYATKDNLFLDAIVQNTRNWRPPELRVVKGQESLPGLLAYAEARIAFLSHPRSRGLMRAIVAQGKAVLPVAECIVAHNSYFGRLMEQCEACMEAGFFEPREVEAVAYCLLAALSFEATAVGDFYGMDAAVNRREIMRKSFALLVTARGRIVVEDYIAAMTNKDDPAQSLLSLPYRPSTTDDVHEGDGIAELRALLYRLGVPSPS